MGASCPSCRGVLLWKSYPTGRSLLTCVNPKCKKFGKPVKK